MFLFYNIIFPKCNFISYYFHVVVAFIIIIYQLIDKYINMCTFALSYDDIGNIFLYINERYIRTTAVYIIIVFVRHNE